MPGHIILTLFSYLGNSTNNTIPTPYIIERKLNGIWCESLDADRRNVTRMLLLMLVPMLVMHLPVSDFILDRRRIRVSSVDTSFISTSHEI